MKNQYTFPEYWNITVKETHDTHVVFECENTDTDEIKFVTIEFKDFEKEFESERFSDETKVVISETNIKKEYMYDITCKRGNIYFFSSCIVGMIE